LGLGPWDKLYGLPKAFWRWFHQLEGGDVMKELKDPETGQVSKEDAQSYYEDWVWFGLERIEVGNCPEGVLHVLAPAAVGRVDHSQSKQINGTRISKLD
jgi:hypothetical protein